jgi:hypothetical protein
MRRTITAFMERNSQGFRRRIPGLVRPTSAGPEPIPIDHLVSPLRYDTSYGNDLELRDLPSALEDFEAFMELSRRQPYFTWFTRVVIPNRNPRNRPQVLDDEYVDAAFERRVRGSIDLHDALESTGFDNRWPIILRTGKEIAATSTGKRLDRRIYAGEGCHRIAWLRMAGVEVLEPPMYRLRRHPTATTAWPIKHGDSSTRASVVSLALLRIESWSSEGALLKPRSLH